MSSLYVEKMYSFCLFTQVQRILEADGEGEEDASLPQ